MARLVLAHPHFSIGNDDAGKARRLKLRDMAREAFPYGKIPDPYTPPNNLDPKNTDFPVNIIWSSIKCQNMNIPRSG